MNNNIQVLCYFGT